MFLYNVTALFHLPEVESNFSPLESELAYALFVTKNAVDFYG